MNLPDGAATIREGLRKEREDRLEGILKVILTGSSLERTLTIKDGKKVARNTLTVLSAFDLSDAEYRDLSILMGSTRFTLTDQTVNVDQVTPAQVTHVPGSGVFAQHPSDVIARAVATGRWEEEAADRRGEAGITTDDLAELDAILARANRQYDDYDEWGDLDS